MDARKSYIGIKNSVDSSVLELFFTDFIFDEMDLDTWEMTNMVQDVIDKIKAANPSSIKATINSLGGDVMIGLAIYNFLKNYDAEVEVEIIGFAASIASIIAMSASPGKLRMAKNSFMIIHSASSSVGGNARDLRGQADVLDTISAEMADIYGQRTGKESKYFTDLWSDGGDHWLTGKEAKNIGLVDELMNAEPITAKLDLTAFRFKNIPTQVFNQLTQNLKSNNMAFPKVIAAAKAESLTVAEGGFLLEEAQLNNIEAKIIAAEAEAAEHAAAIAAAELATTTATTELATAQENADALNSENAELRSQATALNSAITALQAEVKTLGAQASGTGTNLGVGADEGPDEGGAHKSKLSDPDHPVNRYANAKIAAAKKFQTQKS